MKKLFQPGCTSLLLTKLPVVCNSTISFPRISWSSPITTKAKRIVLTQNIKNIRETAHADTSKSLVYAFGFQGTGALGIKNDSNSINDFVKHPTRMKFSGSNDVVDIAAGYGFSAFAVERSDGLSLFGCGLNTDCQLGISSLNLANSNAISYPTAIILPRLEIENYVDLKIRCLSAGRAHLVVVTQNGTIFTMGNNSYGQCCRNIIKDEDHGKHALIHRFSEKEFCANDDEVIDIRCGQDHTMFLTRLGKVYSCGWGADGQTGQGHFSNSGQVTQAKGDISNEKIVKLACSADCVLAINEKGDVFGWGNSEYGQLHTSAYTDTTQVNSPRALFSDKGYGRVIDIAAGGSFCIMLTSEGSVFSWGFGILGFGPNLTQCSTPQKIPAQLLGRNDMNSDSSVRSISCGLFHAGAISSEGDLYVWGRNNCGQLGLGNKKDQLFPLKTALHGRVEKIVFGVDHSLVLCKNFS